jgi:glycosyltransferase involved in cell wall biosynthesis
MELSIIIPTFNEAENIALLLETIKKILATVSFSYEIIVADAGSTDSTTEIAKAKGAQVFIQEATGYGSALKEAMAQAKGSYIVTLDADLSHNPHIIKRLFSLRHNAHLLIASRYTRGGLAQMPWLRRMLSLAVNRFFCFALSLPLGDISSGFRLYNAAIFKEIDFSEKGFSSLIEIVVKTYLAGFRIQEVPFHYQPRHKGASHVRIIKFGFQFSRTFFKLWKIRNSIAAADYDERAFYSRIPLQKFWQRKRYKIITAFLGYPERVLDIGCGSSKILGAFPQAIGLDKDFKKLRYDLYLGNALVNADARCLCFKDNSFDALICSQVIEHLKDEGGIFKEMHRLLKSGGIVVLGTPDYARFSWRLIEWLYKKIIPGGYADEHVACYTARLLIERMQGLGFRLEARKYILGSELICKFIKAS